MSIAELVAELRVAGVMLHADGGKLRYRAPAGAVTPDILERLRTNKDALLEHLANGDADADPTADSTDPADGAVLVPDRANRHQPFPLTDVQAAYLLGRGAAFDYGSVACHGYLELTMPPVDHAALEAGWNSLVAEHDMLRAIVHPDGYQQVLSEVAHYPIAETVTAQDGLADALAATRAELSHLVRRTDQWPLFDLRTTRTADQLVLHVSIDLLICDYGSIRMLLAQLRDRVDGRAARPAAVTFRDYVLAGRTVREGARYATDRAYWWDRMDALPGAPELPLRPDARSAPPRFERHALHLDAAEQRALTAAATAAGLTPSTALLAAFAEVVGYWSRSPRFALSLTLQQRLPVHPDIERTLGDFSSVTVLAVDGAGATLGERAAAVQERLWEDMDHTRCTGVEVLRELAKRRGRAAALLPVTFTSTLAGNERTGSLMPGARLTYGISQTPQVWLDCQVMAEGDDLLVHWDVRAGVFPDGLVEEMFAAFGGLVRRLAGDPAAYAEAEPLDLPAAQRDRLATVNDTATPHDREALHAKVIAQAQRTPERAAVIAGGRTMTYRELLGRARGVAHALAGCAPGERIAIVADKGWEQVAAALGVLLAGGAYLPVDRTQPPLRRDAIFAAAGVRTVLTQARLAGTLADAGVHTVAVDEVVPRWFDGADDVFAGPDDLAYVIYTSGSTGTPKGVMIGHAAARNTIDDINARFAVGPDDRVLGLAQLGFDLSVYDIFGPLSVGGALVLPEPDRRGDPSHWADLIREHAVTLWNSVPAQLAMFGEYLRAAPGELPSLRLAMLSGDWIPVRLPDTIRSLVPTLRVISLGGATEASIWSIWHPIGTVDPALPSIPYGRALANQSFHVLDGRWRDCPELVTGELFIGGIGLAQGYLGDAERTAERFVTHPRTGERLYRTGDLGRRLRTGDIEFLGREDGQVKIRGHRIELAEVEVALQAHPAIRSAAAVVLDDGAGRRLAAFAEPDRRPVPALPTDLTPTVSAAASATADDVNGELVVEMAELLDRSALESMSRFFAEHGLFTGDTAHTADEVIEAVRADPANHHLMRRWLSALVERDWLTESSGRYAGLRTVSAAQAATTRARIDELEPTVRWGADLIRFHRDSEDDLGALVRNEKQMNTMLFPEGRLDTAEAAYRDNLISRYLNTAVVAAVQWIADHHTGPGPLRVLEAGAGVGGTSTVLVPALADRSVDYLFSDVSHFFLNEAAERFADKPWVRYGLFDINTDIRAQGLRPNSFDVVLCANVLHNSMHAGEVLARLRELAAPGAWLVFIEATRDALHVMTSMEFKTGLTGFRDERGATGATFFGRDAWLRMLDEAGAEIALCLPADGDPLGSIGQHVFAARFDADRIPVRDNELLEHLARRLPEYMVPAELQIVTALPLTANGKVDRARLVDWGGVGADRDADGDGGAPRDDLEATIAELFTEILHQPAVGRDGDFFALGGDSLLVAQLVGRLRARLPHTIGMAWDDLLRLVLNRPTVAGLAVALRGTGDRAGGSLVPINGDLADDTAPVLLFVHDGTGTTLPYRTLITELGTDAPMAGLVLDDLDGYLTEDSADLLHRLADRHAAAVVAAGCRRVHLIGYCMGGLLVTELADRLPRAGVEVTGVTIISSYRVPYLVEDDLLAEYVFARVMRADPVAVGYPAEESGIGEVVSAVTARHGDVVPEGSLVAVAEDELGEAGRTALRGLRELAGRSQDERLDRIGAAMPAAPGLNSPDRLRRLYRVVKHSMKVVAEHRPNAYRGATTFIRQLGEAEVFPGMHRDMTVYWTDVCAGGLTVVDVDGDHFTCVRAPHVKAIVDAIAERA